MSKTEVYARFFPTQVPSKLNSLYRCWWIATYNILIVHKTTDIPSSISTPAK